MTATRQQTEHKRPQTPRNEIVRALIDIANWDYSVSDTLSFRSLSPDQSLFDAPTFSVDILQNSQKIGTYKFNVLDDEFLQIDSLRTVVFSPLVIQWAEGGKYKKSGMDKAIIDHCLQTLKIFIRGKTYDYDTAVLTTAYLTKQRAGKAFFTDTGWSIIEYNNKCSRAMSANIEPRFRNIATRIEALSAPNRTSADEKHHVCFAYIVI